MNPDEMARVFYVIAVQRASIIGRNLPAWEKLPDEEKGIHKSRVRELLHDWGLCVDEIHALEQGGALRVEVRTPIPDVHTETFTMEGCYTVQLVPKEGSQ